MSNRISVGTADFAEIAQLLLEGGLVVEPGYYLEVSSAVGNQASRAEWAALEQACAKKGVEIRRVDQMGGVAIVRD